jgi:hypothetical protein
MNEQFELLFVSESEYEHLAIEILFCGQRLCQLSKEKGNNEMDIEFLTDLYLLNEKVVMKFSLDEFERVLQQAKEELKACM